MNVDGATGAAFRRRERRLRSAWRHEQLSAARALAAATHHSAEQNGAPEPEQPPGPGRCEEHEKYEAPRRLEPLSTGRAAKSPAGAWPYWWGTARALEAQKEREGGEGEEEGEEEGGGGGSPRTRLPLEHFLLAAGQVSCGQLCAVPGPP